MTSLWSFSYWTVYGHFPIIPLWNSKDCHFPTIPLWNSMVIRKMGATTWPHYIQICVIMRCVIKGMYCTLQLFMSTFHTLWMWYFKNNTFLLFECDTLQHERSLNDMTGLWMWYFTTWKVFEWHERSLNVILYNMKGLWMTWMVFECDNLQHERSLNVKLYNMKGLCMGYFTTWKVFECNTLQNEGSINYGDSQMILRESAPVSIISNKGSILLLYWRLVWIHYSSYLFLVFWGC